MKKKSLLNSGFCSPAHILATFFKTENTRYKGLTPPNEQKRLNTVTVSTHEAHVKNNRNTDRKVGVENADTKMKLK